MRIEVTKLTKELMERLYVEFIISRVNDLGQNFRYKKIATRKSLFCEYIKRSTTKLRIV